MRDAEGPCWVGKAVGLKSEEVTREADRDRLDACHGLDLPCARGDCCLGHANEGMQEATVQRQAFNRRGFLGKLAGTAGAAVLIAATAGCQSVQQALGPKTNPPPGGTAPTAVPGGPAAGTGAAANGTPAAS